MSATAVKPVSSPVPAPAEDLEGVRRELAVLSERLSSRESVTCFARAFFSFWISIIASGISFRLLVDSVALPAVFFGTLLVSVIAILVLAVNLYRGQRLHRIEGQDFARLLELRARLGFQ